MHKTLSFRALVGYGVGDFGLNIYWNSLTLFLIYWYINVAGLPPEVAGAIFFVGMLWDGITDPIVASIAQRNQTRHGTYRPFLLGGGVALAAAFYLLFWIPPVEGLALAIMLGASHILFRTAYTFVAVPYSALSSRMTYSSVERTNLSGVRMFFALSGLLAVSSMWFPIVRWFGGGNELSQGGSQSAALLGAVVATLALGACYLGTKEKEPLGGTIDQRFTLRGFWQAIRLNDALIILLLTIFFQSAANASFLVSLAFFIDVNHPQFAQKEVIMTVYALWVLLSVPAWTLLIRKYGKKVCWVAACVIVAVSGLDLAIFGARLISGIPLQIIGYAIGLAAFAVLVWSLIPDTVEYGQWRSGVRNEGAAFGSVLFMQKFSGGLVGFGIGIMLSAVGFEADRSLQTNETITGVRLFLALAPSILLILSTMIFLNLPIDRRLHEKIVGDLS